eukprot:scaffold7308_cov114-Isochrysis_galbana.AAC.6
MYMRWFIIKKGFLYIYVASQTTKQGWTACRPPSCLVGRFGALAAGDGPNFATWGSPWNAPPPARGTIGVAEVRGGGLTGGRMEARIRLLVRLVRFRLTTGHCNWSQIPGFVSVSTARLPPD